MFNGSIEIVVKIEAAILFCALRYTPRNSEFLFSLEPEALSLPALTRTPPKKSTSSIITLGLCLLQCMVSCSIVSALEVAGSNHGAVSFSP